MKHYKAVYFLSLEREPAKMYSRSRTLRYILGEFAKINAIVEANYRIKNKEPILNLLAGKSIWRVYNIANRTSVACSAINNSFTIPAHEYQLRHSTHAVSERET
jgi:hypothetical protein